MKIVYTSIFDNYDTLRPIQTYRDWRFICFTNTDIQADGWEVVKIEKEFRINRKVKLLPHLFLPPHNLSIYMDGNIMLADLPDKIAYQKTFCVMHHPDRNNVWDELMACIRLKKDKPEIMRKQVERYHAEGYHGNGLTANGVIIRKNTPEVQKVCEAWWNEVLNESGRDQLSLGYVCWKMGFSIQIIQYLQGFSYRRHDSKVKVSL